MRTYQSYYKAGDIVRYEGPDDIRSIGIVISVGIAKVNVKWLTDNRKETIFADGSGYLRKIAQRDRKEQ